MIVDTSAIVAILFQEPDASLYAEAIAGAEECRISAATLVEASIVVASQAENGWSELDYFMRRAGFSVSPVTEEVARIALEAWWRYGKGRHAAGLNFGDCFSYALSRATGEPLLFKGMDFSKTDLPSVL